MHSEVLRCAARVQPFVCLLRRSGKASRQPLRDQVGEMSEDRIEPGGAGRRSHRSLVTAQNAELRGLGRPFRCDVRCHCRDLLLGLGLAPGC
jgi:hypothetical protein